MKTKLPQKQGFPFSQKENKKREDPTSFKQRNAPPQIYNLSAMCVKERLSAMSVSWRRHFFSRGAFNPNSKEIQPSYSTTDLMSINGAKLVMEAISYRTPLPVTHIIEFSQGDFYPVCPRCDVSLEREYMAYCDRCGQKLSWDVFDKAQWCLSGHKTD